MFVPSRAPLLRQTSCSNVSTTHFSIHPLFSSLPPPLCLCTDSVTSPTSLHTVVLSSEISELILGKRDLSLPQSTQGFLSAAKLMHTFLLEQKSSYVYTLHRATAALRCTKLFKTRCSSSHILSFIVVELNHTPNKPLHQQIMSALPTATE